MLVEDPLGMDQILAVLGVITVVLLLAGVAVVEHIHYARQFHCLGIVELLDETMGNLAEQHSHVEHTLQLHIAGVNSTACGLAQGIVNGIRFTYVYHINLLANTRCVVYHFIKISIPIAILHCLL